MGDGANKVYEHHLEIARRDAREKAAAQAKPGEPVAWSLDVVKHVTGARDARRPTIALLFLQGKCTKAQMDGVGGLKPIDCINAVEQGFVTWKDVAARGVDLKRVEAVRKQTLGRLGIKARTEEEILAGKADPTLAEALKAYNKQQRAREAVKPMAVINHARGGPEIAAVRKKPLTAKDVAIAEALVRAKMIETLRKRIADLKAEIKDTTNALSPEQKAEIEARNQAKGKPIIK